MSSSIPKVNIEIPHIAPANVLRPRGRSGSFVKVEEVGDSSLEQALDEGAYANINAGWVNDKGAWLIHLVLIVAGKVCTDAIPGMTREISWTLVNLIYMALSYLMFHWVTGIPFHNDLHAGAYDDLTLWEQIDDGAQYTPAKKWLFSVPIALFLASTHYTNYDPLLFGINVTALILVLIPKLPQLHRQRVRFLPPASGAETPMTPIARYSPANTLSGMRTPPNEASVPPQLHEATIRISKLSHDQESR